MADGIPYPQAQPPNPMGQLGDLLNVAKGFQEFGSQQRIGEAYARNTNPDGTINWQNLQRDLGNIGWGAQQAVAGGITSETAAFGLRERQMAQAQASADALMGMPGLNKQKIHDFMTFISRTGLQSPGIVNGFLQSVPGDEDPKGQRASLWAFRNMLSAGGPPIQRVDPGSGQIRYLPPSSYGPAMETLPAEPPPPPPPPQSRQPAGRRPTAAPPSPPALPPAPLSPLTDAERARLGGVAGMPVGREAEIKIGTDMENNLRAQARHATEFQVPAIAMMRRDLAVKGLEDKLGPAFRTESVINQWMGRLLGAMPTMTREQIAAGTSFDKLSTQLAMQQAGQLHATDEFMRTAMGANPSVNLPAYTNKGLLDMIEGNMHAIQIKDRELALARSFGIGPHELTAWEANFMRNFDPRVFQFEMMSKKDRQEMMNDIGEREGAAGQQKMKLRLQEAIDNGWITIPEQASSGRSRPVDAYRKQEFGPFR
jgi:hypothetical protein